MTISLWNLLKWEIFEAKAVEEIRAHILCSIPLFRKSYLIGDKVEYYCRVGQATDGLIIRRMRFACWITKVTNTHSKYVILTAFHDNNSYVNALRCYVIYTLRVSFDFHYALPERGLGGIFHARILPTTFCASCIAVERKREYVGGCAAKLYQLCQPHISKHEMTGVLLSRSPLLKNKSDLLWYQPFNRDIEKGNKIFIVTDIYVLNLY